MSRETYIRGFFKVAEENGVDPRVLIKLADRVIRLTSPNMRKQTPAQVNQTQQNRILPAQQTMTPAAPTAVPKAQPPQFSLSAQPKSTAQPFDFDGEARKLLTQFRNQYRGKPGSVSDQGVQRINQMARGMHDELVKMRRNPNVTEQKQRDLLDSWKKRIGGFRGWQSGESKTVGNPHDPNAQGAGWVQVGKGISIIPRKPIENRSDPNYARSVEDAANDNALIKRYRSDKDYNSLMAMADDYMRRTGFRRRRY